MGRAKPPMATPIASASRRLQTRGSRAARAAGGIWLPLCSLTRNGDGPSAGSVRRGYGNPHGRPARGAAVDADAAVQQPRALLDAEQTESAAGALHLCGVEPAAVVHDGERQVVAIARERDLHVARAGVLRHVAQRL